MLLANSGAKTGIEPGTTVPLPANTGVWVEFKAALPICVTTAFIMAFIIGIAFTPVVGNNPTAVVVIVAEINPVRPVPLPVPVPGIVPTSIVENDFPTTLITIPAATALANTVLILPIAPALAKLASIKLPYADADSPIYYPDLTVGTPTVGTPKIVSTTGSVTVVKILPAEPLSSIFAAVICAFPPAVTTAFPEMSATKELA